MRLYYFSMLLFETFKSSKTELSYLGFEKITKEYEKMVNAEVTSVTIHSDLNLRMQILKKTI